MVVFCPGCGSKISVEPASPGGHVECPRCRSQFSTGGLKPADNAPPPKKFRPKKAGRSKAGIWIAFLILILVAGGATGVAYYTGVIGGRTNKPIGSGKPEEPSWQEYTNHDGRFSVLFPGTPTRDIVRSQGRSPKVLAISFSADVPSATYSVAYQDFDGKQTPEQVIDQSRADLSVGKGGKLGGEKDVTAGSVKGKEFTADVPGRGTAYMRFFVSGRRLYKLMVVGSGKSPDPQDVAKFFDSFRISS